MSSHWNYYITITNFACWPHTLLWRIIWGNEKKNLNQKKGENQNFVYYSIRLRIYENIYDFQKLIFLQRKKIKNPIRDSFFSIFRMIRTKWPQINHLLLANRLNENIKIKTNRCSRRIEKKGLLYNLSNNKNKYITISYVMRRLEFCIYTVIEKGFNINEWVLF